MRVAQVVGPNAGDPRPLHELSHKTLREVVPVTGFPVGLFERVIPILVYEDIPAAHDFLVEAFGFTSGGIERNAEGRAVHAEVRAGDLVRVYATGRSIAQADLDSGIVPLPCDHTNDETVSKVFERIRGESGRLDILVNSAWGGYERMVEDAVSPGPRRSGSSSYGAGTR